MIISTKVKKMLVFGFIFSICSLLIIVSGATPELNYIRDKIPYINELDDPVLLVGETCTVDDLSITVKNVELVTDPNEGSPYLGVHEGAKILFVDIEVINIGDVPTPGDTLQDPLVAPFVLDMDEKNRFKLHYADTTIYALASLYYQHTRWKGFGDKYPGVIKEGWLAFEVPGGINLNETIFEVYENKWILSA